MGIELFLLLPSTHLHLAVSPHRGSQQQQLYSSTSSIGFSPTTSTTTTSSSTLFPHTTRARINPILATTSPSPSSHNTLFPSNIGNHFAKRMYNSAQSSHQDANSSRKRLLLTFGDSLTAGWYNGGSVHPYSKRLEQLLNDHSNKQEQQPPYKYQVSDESNNRND